MKRYVAIGVAGLAAALAMAAVVIVGAKGTGGAVNAAGVKWGFAMDVKKSMSSTSNEVRVLGFCRVRREFRDGDHVMLVTINMDKADKFEVGNDLRGAKFTGRAVRVIKRDGVVVREDHGAMAVSVNDRHEGNTGNEPDLLSFNYRPVAAAVTNEGVSFSGRVYWGDIDVYRRVE